MNKKKFKGNYGNYGHAKMPQTHTCKLFNWKGM